ncbi:hypothetical protein CLJ_B2235 [Clostridium botulinum Ba4 str. 657]|uniref:Uncharacterized protein n=1 Tax=Clostridium botulinum (strain 657 / Type Ba4) TaxID=515621 RepID=A0A3F3A278_CLOB6|nr:hypothetical protein CLJ_B2235 [Clostridium botulinum Ba4 str. 657]
MRKGCKLDPEKYLSKTNIFLCKKKSELLEKETLHINRIE